MRSKTFQSPVNGNDIDTDILFIYRKRLLTYVPTYTPCQNAMNALAYNKTLHRIPSSPFI